MLSQLGEWMSSKCGITASIRAQPCASQISLLHVVNSHHLRATPQRKILVSLFPEETYKRKFLLDRLYPPVAVVPEVTHWFSSWLSFCISITLGHHLCRSGEVTQILISGALGNWCLCPFQATVALLVHLLSKLGQRENHGMAKWITWVPNILFAVCFYSKHR